MKKTLSLITVAAVVFMSLVFVPASHAEELPDSTKQYSYEITPIMEPFNNFFFVKTDNPDPESFCFIDEDSRYENKGANDSRTINLAPRFADVAYDDEETLRLSGGYLFRAPNRDVDGGNIVLKEYKYVKREGWGSFMQWTTSPDVYTLPPLVDDFDYLIETYGEGEGFWSKMNAIQDTLRETALYSGPSTRGKVMRRDREWMISVAGYIDQSFSIQSPYYRSDALPLFASWAYPYRLDSIAFPSTMAIISQRLEPTSTYEWMEGGHAYISVTFDGQTGVYGGAGSIEGKKVNDSQILRKFTFDSDDAPVTLESAYKLLIDYSKVETEDDIPRDDELTWKQVYDTVGDGAWARLYDGDYTYFYDCIGDGTNFKKSDFDNGGSLYWWGDLGYCRDTWADGRYIGEWCVLKPGATFADYPNGNVLVKNATIPLITYQRGSIRGIAETTATVLYLYDSETDEWHAASIPANSQYAVYGSIRTLVKQGRLDQKYLDMVTLTRAQVEAMQVDSQTNVVPQNGFVYDGKLVPGTPFDASAEPAFIKGDVNGDGTVEICDATMIQEHVAERIILTEEQKKAADTNGNGVVDITDATLIQKYIAELIDFLG